MRTHVRLSMPLLSFCLLTLGCGSSAVPVVTRLAVNPVTVQLSPGASQQFSVAGGFIDGTSTPLITPVVWTSSSPIASISSSGLLQASGNGSVTITGTSGQFTGSAQVQILPNAVPSALYTTSVAPSPGDDLAGPCAYDLFLPDSSRPVTGTWVLFERQDSLGLWQDDDLRALAAKLQLGLVYAHQCNAASYADLQSDGRKGPAHALATALTAFASLSGHPELGRTNLALFGFSAAGVLSITTAEWMPTRILTVVTYAAGSTHLELRRLTPSTAFQAVPLLVLDNALDNRSGTSMGEQYFLSGRVSGAPWTFAVQPGAAHCCTLSTKPVLLAWLSAVLPLRLSPAGAAPVVLNGATSAEGAYRCIPDGVIDGSGYTDCVMSSASIIPRTNNPNGTAWLPTQEFGQAWLSWMALSAPATR